ncbi:oxidoreductase [Phycicoccus sonneratiae]|uniref:Oxidoreductase n=1 Tax=Phycicoccus sonneratiae TaxID=2807628 RepID=A0ABS2CH73_9MICO|nr:oxidoreductase [Phycicoccus sonneraticus]MBM6399227.1 oxidoreductase [Phycicoccus sonneraticus]
MTTLYEQAGGAEGMLALSHAWHARCLADPVAAHPFEHPGHPEHVERLAAYWGEALGGPPAYTDGMGDEAHVSRMHAGEGEHAELDRACIACFDVAMTDVGLTTDPLRTELHDYFVWSTGRLSAHPGSADRIADDLTVPRWPQPG